MTYAPEGQPLRGRPGTKALPLLDARAVGGPIALGLLAAYCALALAGWIAAAVVLLLAAPDLAAGNPLAELPVLATHLVTLGVLPLAVTGAAFHLLPVMLRNDVRRPRLLQLAVPLLAGGYLLAPGVALGLDAAVWVGSALVAGGLAIVAVELLGLAWRAPGERILVASRTGVVLVVLHVVAALVLGALAFGRLGSPFAGVRFDRWLLVHLNLGAIGWLTLLIVTVGRTLVPMLSFAPTAGKRRYPDVELATACGLWVLLAGLAGGWQPVTLVGGAVVVLAVGRFLVQAVAVARTKRAALEAPLGHVLAGVVLLAEAAVLGFLAATGAIDQVRAATAYVLLLVLGWGAGVTVGHLGKLLSLSLWVWWPPGPRPKQGALYPRRLWLVEAGLFAVGVQLLAAGVLAGSEAAAWAGGVGLLASALLAAGGTAWTWRARWDGARPANRPPG